MQLSFFHICSMTNFNKRISIILTISRQSAGLKHVPETRQFTIKHVHHERYCYQAGKNLNLGSGQGEIKSRENPNFLISVWCSGPLSPPVFCYQVAPPNVTFLHPSSFTPTSSSLGQYPSLLPCPPLSFLWRPLGSPPFHFQMRLTCSSGIVLPWVISYKLISPLLASKVLMRSSMELCPPLRLSPSISVK